MGLTLGQQLWASLAIGLGLVALANVNQPRRNLGTFQERWQRLRFRPLAWLFSFIIFLLSVYEFYHWFSVGTMHVGTADPRGSISFSDDPWLFSYAVLLYGFSFFFGGLYAVSGVVKFISPRRR